MKFIIRFFAFTIVFSCLATTAMAASSVDKSLQDTIDYYREKYKIPGIALSVKLPGEKLIHDYFTGSASIIHKTPIDKSSLFHIGGVSKSFTAAIILQLEAEGKLKLDDPLGKWLKQYPDWAKISIRQLLNETSGISDYMAAPHFIPDLTQNTQNNNFSIEDLADIAYQQQPNMRFKTGSQWEPSSTNYALLGLIIQKITGHTFNNELSLRLTQPLNLSNTYYFPYPPHALNHLVHGYEADGVTDTSYFNMSWEGPAGGIISTAHDIVLWVNDLFTGKVLQPKQFSKMTTLVSMESARPLEKGSYLKGVGLGIEAGNVPFAKKYGIVYAYEGNTLGYRAQFVYLPCYDTIVALTINNVSLEKGERAKILEYVLKAIVKSSEWQAYKKAHQPKGLPAACKKAWKPRLWRSIKKFSHENAT